MCFLNGGSFTCKRGNIGFTIDAIKNIVGQFIERKNYRMILFKINREKKRRFSAAKGIKLFGKISEQSASPRQPF